MARVIRNGNGRVIKASLSKAQENADELIQRAEAQAAATLSAAKDEASALEATLRAQTKEAVLAECAETLLSAEAYRIRTIEESASEIQSLALSVAQHLIGEELALSPEKIRSVCLNAVSRVKRARRISVRVHPEDVGYLDGLGWECIADAELSRGDCIVKSDLGVVDATIKTRLEAVRLAWQKKNDE